MSLPARLRRAFDTVVNDPTFIFVLLGIIAMAIGAPR